MACHPLIARNGRDRRRLLGSAAQLPDEFRLGARRGRAAGFALSPAHCDDGVLLPFVAIGTTLIVKVTHILLVSRVIVKAVFGWEGDRTELRRRQGETKIAPNANPLP